MTARPSDQESASTGGLQPPDLNEYGGKKDGERQAMNRRLFVQLLVFDVVEEAELEATTQHLLAALSESGIGAVVYEDANAPRGLGLLTFAEDPAHFVQAIRPLFRRPALRALRQRTGFTMLGRTYASGYEPDLEHWLLRRPIENVTHPDWRWGVWYPLRRSGAFARLAKAEQAQILREHAAIGLAYGRGELAHDVRLACHGLDAEDNEYVIGLIGKTLHPLSHVVERMRSTVQTSTYIEKMGPFFIGYARWQNRGDGR